MLAPGRVTRTRRRGSAASGAAFHAYPGAATDRAAAAFAATAYAQVQDSVIACDLSGRVHCWNRVAAQVCSCSAEEICGRPLARLIPAAGRPPAPPASVLLNHEIMVTP